VPERVAELDVQRLTPGTGTFKPGRNIFRFGSSAAPGSGPAAQTVPKKGATKPDGTGEPAKVAKDGQPSPPPVDLRYLGSFGPDSAPIVVFSDGQKITNARQGDVVEDRFIVRRIGYESVDLGFVGFPEDVVHRLGTGR
jgi:hypothetical protein